MNAQPQAFPAPPGLRQRRPESPGLESGQNRGPSRGYVPPIEQRFAPPVRPHGVDLDAKPRWPDLPGIRRASHKRAAELGRSPVAWGVTAMVAVVSLMGIAVKMVHQISGPVIVHLVWPV